MTELLVHAGSGRRTADRVPVRRALHANDDARSTAALDGDDDLDAPLDEFDDELYRDDDDRRRLAALPEFERVRILQEREDKRNERRQFREVQRALRRRDAGEDGELSDDSPAATTRRSARTGRPETDRLLELKRKRQELHGAKAARRSPYASSPHRQRSLDDEAHGDGGWSGDEARSRKARAPDPLDAPAAKEDALPCYLTRDTLQSWMFKPFLDSAVVSALVKINVGPNEEGVSQYRVGVVMSIVHERPYRLGEWMTDVRLLCKHGKAEKRFGLDVLSNGPLSEREFQRYQLQCQKDGALLYTLRDVKRAKANIEYGINYVMKDEDVSFMLRERKRLDNTVHVIPLDAANAPALKVAKLREDLREAYAARNAERAATLEVEMLEMERANAAAQVRRNSKLDAMAEVNKRNRAANMESIREAEIAFHREKAERYAKGVETAKLEERAKHAAPVKLETTTQRAPTFDELMACPDGLDIEL